MPFSGHDEEEGPPITFGQCSNGEYEPEPITPVRLEMERLARTEIDIALEHTGMTRREFIRSASALAICLTAIDAAVAGATGSPAGRFYPFDPIARYDTDAARSIIGPAEFVFDVQGHLLEYDLDPSTAGDWFWGNQFPQARCEEEDDPRACFATNHFLEEIFIRSDTTMVALSGLPINPEGSPLSNQVMEETRQLVVALAGDERVVVNALALPQTATPGAVAEEMHRTVSENRIAGWKTFTHFPSSLHWWLDDHDPALPAVGGPFLVQLVALGTPILFVHKGLSDRCLPRLPDSRRISGAIRVPGVEPIGKGKDPGLERRQPVRHRTDHRSGGLHPRRVGHRAVGTPRANPDLGACYLG